MFIVTIKRIIKTGLINFYRNGWVSTASVLIMVLALFIIQSAILANVLLTSTLAAVEEKVDVSVYFKLEAVESEVLNIKTALEELQEVASVNYISREESLQQFRDRHGENALISNSLEELGDNPFGATLNVRAKTPSQYESVALFLERGDFSAIDKINYRKNQVVIDRLASIISLSRRAGAVVGLVLLAIAMLIVFNTIRLAIFTSRDEIGVMKLVGASKPYIRSPFIVVGSSYGVVAAVVTMIITWPLTFWLGPFSERLFGGINISTYFNQNFFSIFGALLLIGVLLGGISSFIATRRYLKL